MEMKGIGIRITIRMDMDRNGNEDGDESIRGRQEEGIEVVIGVWRMRTEM